MIQDIGEMSQAAIIKLPFDFRTGIMRGRVNPKDGQVYATGLQGWNGGGRIGLLENGIQRLRYTGKTELMVTNCQVEPDGLRIEFNQPLDSETATNRRSYRSRAMELSVASRITEVTNTSQAPRKGNRPARDRIGDNGGQ